MAYNVATALCVLQLLDRCARPVPKILQVGRWGLLAYHLIVVFILIVFFECPLFV